MYEMIRYGRKDIEVGNKTTISGLNINYFLHKKIIGRKMKYSNKNCSLSHYILFLSVFYLVFHYIFDYRSSSFCFILQINNLTSCGWQFSTGLNVCRNINENKLSELISFGCETWHMSHGILTDDTCHTSHWHVVMHKNLFCN